MHGLDEEDECNDTTSMNFLDIPKNKLKDINQRGTPRLCMDNEGDSHNHNNRSKSRNPHRRGVCGARSCYSYETEVFRMPSPTDRGDSVF